MTLTGTAKQAQLDGYSAAGKTGTAQKIDPRTRAYSATKYVASFVGFAPVSNPQVVIIVVIDEPAGAYHGGDVAAPVFREVAEQILPGLGVMPDIETKSAPQLVAQVPEIRNGRRSCARSRPNPNRSGEPHCRPWIATAAGAGEVVYAVATKKAMLMPDLRGRSVRDVARTCAQLDCKWKRAAKEGFSNKARCRHGSEYWDKLFTSISEEFNDLTNPDPR